MEKRRRKHIDKNLIHFSELKDMTKKDLLSICPIDATYVIDTESCFKNDNILFEKIDTNTKFKKGVVKQIPLRIIDIKHRNTDEYKKDGVDKKIKNKDFNFEVHVYAWAIANDLNDIAIYGENIDDMFLSFDFISKKRVETDKPIKSDSKIKQIKKDMKFKCFVHNLAWDMEFFKYSLNRLGLDYNVSKVDKEEKRKINKKSVPNEFQIIENDNVVYMSNISLGEPLTIKYEQKVKGEILNRVEQVFTQIQLIDSMKIQAITLDTIGKSVVDIDKMFNKMSSEYDYNRVRRVGHTLTQFEKEYLYNDVYILKSWVKQFYNPLRTNQTTASGIAFETFLNDTFDGEKNKYKKFEETYPELNNQVRVYKIIKDSYKGGWTQSNKKYTGLKHRLNNAISVDINSSYPAVVRNQPLPYGQPKYFNGFKKSSKNQASILTIHFDAFKNKKDDNYIGEFQVGALSAKEFNLLGTDYISSNIFKDVVKGTNGKSESHRYKICIWDFELENILENTILYSNGKSYDAILGIYHSNDELYEKYMVESTLIFDTNIGFFGDTVDKLTLKKIEGKRSGNIPLEIYSKLCLNSFYGKLASNTERHERMLLFNNKGLAEFKNTDNLYETDKKYYPAFASAVTAWARVNLRKRLYEIGYDNILYFDTDSLYTTLNYKEIVEKIGEHLHPTELGKWDIEKQYTEFKAIGSKKYIMLCRPFNKNTVYRKLLKSSCNVRVVKKPFKIKLSQTIRKKYKLTRVNNFRVKTEIKRIKINSKKVLCKCAGLPYDVRKTLNFEDFYLGNTFTGKKVKTRVLGGYVLIEGEYKLTNIVRN